MYPRPPPAQRRAGEVPGWSDRLLRAGCRSAVGCAGVPRLPPRGAARAAARRRRGRAAGHRPGQRPLPDRLHRVQRGAAGARRRRRRQPVLHRRPLPHAGRRGGARPGAGDRPGQRPSRWPAAAAGSAVHAARLRVRRTSPSTHTRRWPTPRPRACCCTARRGWCSGCALVKDDDRDGRPARRVRRRRRRARRPASPPAGCAPGAPSARSPRPGDTGCAATARTARRSRRSSRPARTPRCRTTGPTAPSLRRGDLVKMDFGALVDGYHSDMTRTVVLGPAAGWQRELYALVARGAGGRARAPHARHAGRRRRRRGPRGGRERRVRRRVRARAGARRRPADPRGAAAGRHRERRAGRRAWPSPSSPGSTWRAAAACASRTRWWSATATPEVLTRSPRELLEIT